MNPPTTPKQVRAFLRLVGYYRKFIKGFAKIAKPLTLLTRQQVKFDWTPEHQAAFTYCLIKQQYYWKGMNKEIRKYIANCVLCRCDKAKV